MKKHTLEREDKISLPFARNLLNKYGKKLLDSATKTELGDAKPLSRKVVTFNSWSKGELIWNKVTEKFIPDENSINLEEIFIKRGKRQEMINKLRQVL